MENKPLEKGKRTETQAEDKQLDLSAKVSATEKVSNKRAFSKPVLKKFRQIDYVATYGSK